jgi:hypothetical protein
MSGPTTLNGTLKVDVNDADAGVVDLLNNSAGVLDISSATSTVDFDVVGTPSATAYVFASYGSLLGSAFGNVLDLPSGYSIDYNYQGNKQIALVAGTVPEPTSLALLALAGCALRRKRNCR